jgi:hypothetical protein
MEEKIKVADLSHLAESLIEAAQGLVDTKFRVDVAARNSPKDIPDDLHGPMRGGEYGPNFGMCFFNSIIPFLPREWEVEEPELLSVPVAHTFGCSWRWWPDRYLKDDDEMKIRNHIFSDYGIRSTSYTAIPELGLFLPHEGKNRVNFCRHHNIEYLPARVYMHHYPHAERIKLYVLDVAGGKDVWAVLDDRFVQKISHYDYALPLLRAYGVAVLGKWPEELPSLISLLEHADHCTDCDTFHHHVLDANAVKKVVEEKELYVKCALLDLPVHRKYRFLVWIFLIWLMAVATWGAFDEGIVGKASLTIFAFTSGIIAVGIAPIMKIKKKYLEG